MTSPDKRSVTIERRDTSVNMPLEDWQKLAAIAIVRGFKSRSALIASIWAERPKMQKGTWYLSEALCKCVADYEARPKVLITAQPMGAAA